MSLEPNQQALTTQVSNRHRRHGNLVVLFALLLPVLIVIMGFTIDYANMQRVRNEIRVVADLSAKAAADNLAITRDPAQAAAVAQQIAAANFVAGEPVFLDEDQIVFGQATRQSDGSFVFAEGVTPLNSVRVNATRTEESESGGIDLFFGRFYGRQTFGVAQSSTASFVDVEICLVLDRSGSMKWPLTGGLTEDEMMALICQPPNQISRWFGLDAAVESFLTELESTPTREKVGLVTFASDTNVCSTSIQEVTLNQPLTTNVANVRSRMDSLRSSIWDGSTNINAGLELARTHMSSLPQPTAQRIIILLTDGQYNLGGSPFDTATACRNAGITVHTITFSDDANQSDMQTVAANGGGTHHHASTNEQLETIFRRLAGSASILTE